MENTSLTQGQRRFGAILLFCFASYMAIILVQALGDVLGLTLPEPTFWGLVHSSLAIYCTITATIMDRITHCVDAFLHILFAATHTLEALVLVDKVYWYNHKTLLRPTVPITNFVKRNPLCFGLLNFLSICYLLHSIAKYIRPDGSQPESTQPLQYLDSSVKTHSISISTQTDDWTLPIRDESIRLLQADPQPEEDLEQANSGHRVSSSKSLLTKEQVDSILAHAKEEQDRNAEQQRSKLKKQLNQSEAGLQHWRSAHGESLRTIARLKKTVDEAAQKHSDRITFEKKQTRDSRRYNESATAKYKLRAKAAEDQLVNVKDKLDDSEQRVKSLRVLLREKRPSGISQPSVHITQDDKVDTEVQLMRTQLEDANTKNQALIQELEVARSAPNTQLMKMQDELTAVTAHSAEIEAQLKEKNNAYTKLESRMKEIERDHMSDGEIETRYKTTKEQLNSKSNAYTKLESHFESVKRELASVQETGVSVQSQLDNVKSQLSSKTNDFAELESRLEEVKKNSHSKANAEVQSQLDSKTKAYTELELQMEEVKKNWRVKTESDARALKEQFVQECDSKFQEINTAHQQEMADVQTAKLNVEHSLATERQNSTNYQSQAATAFDNWQSKQTEMQNTIDKLTGELTKMEIQHKDFDSTITRLHDELEPLRDQAVKDAIILPRLKAIATAIDPHIERFEGAINKRIPVEWLERLFDSITDEYFEEWYNDFVARDLAEAVPGQHGRASKRAEENSDLENSQTFADPSERPKKQLRKNRRTNPNGEA